MGTQFIMAVLAAIAVALCAGAVNAFNSFRRTTPDQMGEFCRLTRNRIDLQESLITKLGLLKATLNDTMDDIEQQLTFGDPAPTRFSQQQVLSSVITDLVRMQRGLTCMGRALDFLCRHPRYYQCPRHLPRLYPHHLLPSNARSLRSDLAFSLTYHSVMFLLQQLLASVNMAGGRHSDGCWEWENNSALVLRWSYETVSGVQAFVEDVSLACEGYL